MDIIFETTDKTGRKIKLNQDRYKHILGHPHMHKSIERIKLTITNPLTIRYNENDEKSWS